MVTLHGAERARITGGRGWQCGVLPLGAILAGSSCGGQVDLTATASGSVQNTGGAGTAIDAAGSTSAGANSSTGGSDGTGDATTFDFAYCGGLLEGNVCGVSHHSITGDPVSCVLPLDESPPDRSRTLLVIDCKRFPLLNTTELDSGAPNGYWIDYDFSPAHLILMGTACDAVGAPGHHTLDLINRCTIVL